MSREVLVTLTTEELEAIVASTVPTGKFAAEVVWAKAELARRARQDAA